MRARGLVLAALLLAPLALVPAASAAGPEVLVAAAANLANAFREILPAADRALGIRTQLVLGATGQLRQQIEQGAPYDVLFAADVASIAALRERGLVRPEDVHIYAFGSLILAWPAGGARLAGLADLTQDRVRRVALASPDLAPYGNAAREALVQAGLWGRVEPKVVYGANIAQAYQFLQTRNVDAAFLARSMAAGDRIGYLPVDPRLYQPIAQAAGVVARAAHAEPARRLVRFLMGPEGQALLERFGYQAPPHG